MSRQPVPAFGGPLDGGMFDLDPEPGALIELAYAAGVCTYQFGTSQSGAPILDYIGVRPLDGGRQTDERA